MQKLRKEIELEVIDLLKAHKPVEAMMLVETELQLGFKEAKKVIDIYREQIKKE
jgi:hypothetical protein